MQKGHDLIPVLQKMLLAKKFPTGTYIVHIKMLEGE